MNETFRCTYPNEEEALRQLSLVAKLKPGDVVRYKDQDNNGKIIKGVFFGFDEHCRAKIVRFDPADSSHDLGAIPPVWIVFQVRHGGVQAALRNKAAPSLP